MLTPFSAAYCSKPGSCEKVAEMVRTGAGYAFLVTALATSPIGVLFVFVPLMVTVGRTPLGAWLWDHLHIVYIGLSLVCLVALAGACCLLRRRR